MQYKLRDNERCGRAFWGCCVRPHQHAAVPEGFFMAIYLDEQTRPYLERLLKNIKETDFIGKRIQGMLEADAKRLDEISKCEHISGEYIGHKTCCTKCGSFFEPGMGQSWTLKQETDRS